MATWLEFLGQSRPQVDYSEAGLVLCLDPGETTGAALFDKGELVRVEQWDTGRDPSATSDAIFATDASQSLHHIVYEEYRIRSNRAKQHIGSEVVTIQHIGAIKVAAAQLYVPVFKQTAGQVKDFATDAKLRRWGLYQPNMRHANDAIRHGVYWHLFIFGRRDPSGRSVRVEPS